MSSTKSRSNSPGFLLAQVGGHAASKFAERLAPLNLTPAEAGILRLLNFSPGTSQQELAAKLGMHPSRLVAVLDALEERGLVERRPNAEDRRQYCLHVTSAGTQLLQDVGRVAREHQDVLLKALSLKEREQLMELLKKIAEDQGLVPGVHPGYRWMKSERSGRPPSA
jgi:DNA-binding MarR family transcriptional regulator